MKTTDWPEYFLEVVELEVNLKDLYRYRVLEQPFEEILENRFDWSIKEYFKSGDKIQKDTSYVGPFNTYRAKVKALQE